MALVQITASFLAKMVWRLDGIALSWLGNWPRAAQLSGLRGERRAVEPAAPREGACNEWLAGPPGGSAPRQPPRARSRCRRPRKRPACRLATGHWANCAAPGPRPPPAGLCAAGGTGGRARHPTYRRPPANAQCTFCSTKTHSSGEENPWEDKLSVHHIRGWSAVSAARLQGVDSHGRSVFF